MGKVIRAIFMPGQTRTSVGEIWQWDYGLTLEIQGLSLPESVQVGFSVDGSGPTRDEVGVTVDGTMSVPIPNDILNMYGHMTAYIRVVDETSRCTEYTIEASIKEQPMPSMDNGDNDYGDEEARGLFWETVKSVNEAAEQTKTAAAGIVADREQIQTNKTDIGSLKETLVCLTDGGCNYAIGTEIPFIKDSGFGGADNKTPFYPIYLPDDVKAGDYVTISFDYECTNILAENGETPSWLIEGSGNINGWGESRYPHNGNLPINSSGHWSYTTKLLQKAVENDYWNMDVKCTNISSGYIKVWNYKFEKGTIKSKLDEHLNEPTFRTEEHYEWKKINHSTQTDGKLIRSNLKTNSNANWLYRTFDVLNFEQVKISGLESNADFPLAVCVNDNNVVTGTIYTGATGATYLTNYQATLPEGTTKIHVNGQNNLAESIKGELQGYVRTDTVIKEKNGYKIMTLGDSITALGTGDRGWIKYFMESIPSQLVANVAVNGAVLTDYSDTVLDGNPVQGTQKNNTLANQVQKILNANYEYPDIIMISIGTNGGIDGNLTYTDIDKAYNNAGALIGVDSVDRKTTAGSFRYATEKLHNKYPNAVIFWCCPIHAYNPTHAIQCGLWETALEKLTGYQGTPLIHTNRCGISSVYEVSGGNGENLIDGLHPNANGAKKSDILMLAKLKSILI